jgi:hypothetical protein
MVAAKRSLVNPNPEGGTNLATRADHRAAITKSSASAARGFLNHPTCSLSACTIRRLLAAVRPCASSSLNAHEKSQTSACCSNRAPSSRSPSISSMQLHRIQPGPKRSRECPKPDTYATFADLGGSRPGFPEQRALREAGQESVATTVVPLQGAAAGLGVVVRDKVPLLRAGGASGIWLR